jgi:acetyl esterase/lipase
MMTTKRDMFRLAAAASAATMLGRSAAAFAPAATPDPLAHVAPELRPFARKMLAAPPLILSDETVRRVRAGAGTPGAAADGSVMRTMVPVRSGWPDVAVQVMNARTGTRRPAVLHMHGGGFVGGTAGESVPRLLPLARMLDCVIVSVDYRLAPEAPYTVSTEENYAALRWLYRAADGLGVDRDRIAVMGESAGGGHAALLALAARDRGEVPLAFQALIYPMLDDRTGSTRRLPAFFGAVGWTPANNAYGWRSFLGTAPGGATVPARAVPARRADLAGLPPTFIGVGGIDLFASEDVDYARRLLEAGVPTELLVVPGAFHGFDRMVPDAAVARQFTAAKVQALRRGLSIPA